MTAIQEAVPAAAGAAQSRGGEVSNAAAAAGKRVRARKHDNARFFAHFRIPGLT